MRNGSHDTDLRSETTKILGVEDGLLKVFREQVLKTGPRMGGVFFCNPDLRFWIADQLEIAAADELFEVRHDLEPDHLMVTVRGGERADPINISVYNRRVLDDGSVAGCLLEAMSPEVARDLAQALRSMPDA